MSEPRELIVMRLKDMARVHPDQITARCSKCNEEVGIYPSGQRALKEMPDLKLVCQVCKGEYDINILAPGAMTEAFESTRRDGTRGHTHLPMWTIYIRKEGGYIAVCWAVTGNEGDEPQPTGIALESETLQPLREALLQKGLVPIARNDDDDDTIIETWL